MRRTTIRGLAFAAGGPLAAAVVGGLGSRSAPRVYAELRKPSWAPPAEAFGLAPYLAWSLFATALNVAVEAPGAA